MENSSKSAYPAPDRTWMYCLGHKILEQMVMFLLVTLKRKEDNYGSGMEGNWNLLRKIPVQVRTYTSSMMMDEPVLFIQSVTKIEKEKPPTNKFRIPGKKEGFTKGSMMDMMMEIMSKDE